MLRHAPGFLILFSAGNLLETCPWGVGTKILGGHVKEKMADKTHYSHLQHPTFHPVGHMFENERDVWPSFYLVGSSSKIWPMKTASPENFFLILTFWEQFVCRNSTFNLRIFLCFLMWTIHDFSTFAPEPFLVLARSILTGCFHLKTLWIEYL